MNSENKYIGAFREGRKLGKIPRCYERVNSKGEKINVETYFSYINRVH